MYVIDIRAFRAMKRGLYPNQHIHVSAWDPEGKRINGTVIGIGSKMSIRTDAGAFVEDVRAEWVRSVTVEETPLADARCNALPASEAGRRGYTVECHCTRPYGGAYWVKTPCCEGGRRNVNASDVITCPDCRWVWKIQITSDVTLWTSMGYGR